MNTSFIYGGMALFWGTPCPSMCIHGKPEAERPTASTPSPLIGYRTDISMKGEAGEEMGKKPWEGMVMQLQIWRLRLN